MELSILGYKCKKCGYVQYPHRTLCRKCLHNEFDTVPLAKEGKLVTFTILHTLPPDFEVPTLGLGIVELDDGQKIMGQLAIDKPKIGMRVRSKIENVRCEEYDTYKGVVFYT